MSDLRRRLAGLGLSHYYDVFVAEGFDTWETILDVTESDLNALGVKLGHRRKLQRAILETRNQYPEHFLPLLHGKPANADASYRSDDSATEAKTLKKRETVSQSAPGATSKRKYRRHPKPDENAPERPPSAYVIFSNQMREELKTQELSFTEIAKVVGERWQVLSPESREIFERQANTAKEKYYAELAEYKKTPQYVDYQEYLKDFKMKHGPYPGEGKKARLETETSGSTRSSSHEQSERPDRLLQGSGHSDGILTSHARSESSPPRSSYNRSLRQPISQSTSPALYPFPSVNSPRVGEQYSPVSLSPTTTTMVREVPPFDQHSSGYAGRESSIPPPPSLHSYPSTSSTSPSLASYGSQYQHTRDLPTRRPYRDPSSLPPLTRDDTTLSSTTISSNASHGSARPESRLPTVDPSKAQRMLPQPVPMLNAQPSPLDQRSHQAGPGLPGQGPELRTGSASLAALLRASELARDADDTQTDNDRPP